MSITRDFDVLFLVYKSYLVLKLGQLDKLSLGLLWTPKFIWP